MLGCGCMVERPTTLGGLGKGGPNLTQDYNELTQAGYVVSAPASSNILDAFGSQNRTLVEIGLAGVAVLVLVKMLK